jgi:DNA-binding MarR family transcriptional regulator
MRAPDILARIAILYDRQSAAVEPALQRLNCSWVTFQLLTVLHGQGSVSQAEVARRLGVSPATLSESVRGHLARGLIRQTASGSDKRLKLLSLSDSGQKMLSNVVQEMSMVELKMVSILSEREVATLSKLLDKLISSLPEEE